MCTKAHGCKSKNAHGGKWRVVQWLQSGVTDLKRGKEPTGATESLPALGLTCYFNVQKRSQDALDDVFFFSPFARSSRTPSS